MRFGKCHIARAAEITADGARAAVELQRGIVCQNVVARIRAAGIEAQSATVDVDHAARRIVERGLEATGRDNSV